MAEEQSIKEQIAAMEGWAIEAKQNADSGKYEEAEELLRTINVQGRRLEWRGGRLGLKHLPEMEEIRALKLRVSEARAAAQKAQSSVEHLGKLAKKGEKKPEENEAIKKKEKGYQKETVSNISILIQVLKEARAVMDLEPWFSPKSLSNPKNKKALIDFLCFTGYYQTAFPNHQEDRRRLEIFANINFEGMDFEGEKLNGIVLYGANVTIKNCSFRKAQLENMVLWGVYFQNVDFRGVTFLHPKTWLTTTFTSCRLDGAKFTGPIFGSKFNQCQMVGADFSNYKFPHQADDYLSAFSFEYCNLQGANFQGAIVCEENTKKSTWVRFVNSNLSQANFRGAKMNGTWFYGSIRPSTYLTVLDGTNFAGGSFRFCEFVLVSARETNFEGADLTLTKFDRVSLLGAKFEGTTLDLVHLKESPLDKIQVEAIKRKYGNISLPPRTSTTEYIFPAS